MLFKKTLKEYNENHDEHGRFASGGSAQAEGAIRHVENTGKSMAGYGIKNSNDPSFRYDILTDKDTVKVSGKLKSSKDVVMGQEIQGDISRGLSGGYLIVGVSKNLTGTGPIRHLAVKKEGIGQKVNIYPRDFFDF